MRGEGGHIDCIPFRLKAWYAKKHGVELERSDGGGEGKQDGNGTKCQYKMRGEGQADFEKWENQEKRARQGFSFNPGSEKKVGMFSCREEKGNKFYLKKRGWQDFGHIKDWKPSS